MSEALVLIVLVVGFVAFVNLLVVGLIVAASWTDKADELAALRRLREQGRVKGIGGRSRRKAVRSGESWSGPDGGRW